MDEDNWVVYEVYDQLESFSDIQSYSLHRQINSSNNKIDREKIVTYTASGLVGEFFEYLVANSNSIAMGCRMYGVSVLKFEDVESPRGKIYNFRKPGLQGIAEYEDKFYAWFYDGSIVDVASGEIIYTDAPIGTSTNYGPSPKNRFIINGHGELYIGTSEVDEDGLIVPNSDNGFWKIDSSLSNKTKLIDHPVWSVYHDSRGDIWVGTKNGIYKGTNDVFEKVFSDCADQIFEYNNETYAITKNFFNYPFKENDFSLYRWDGNSFIFVCSIEFGWTVGSMHAFEWENTLYVSSCGSEDNLLVFDGNSFDLQHRPIFDGQIGQFSSVKADGKLFSAGGGTGIRIWDGYDSIHLYAQNTAEALISNDISVLYFSDEGDLYIGPKVNGFNIMDDFGNFDSVAMLGETMTTGFFERNGITYVQGAQGFYQVSNNDIQFFTHFPCNGERVYYDKTNGKLWSFPNFGIGNGNIGMLDIDTKIVWGTPDVSGPIYWQTDYEWERIELHFNDVISIPNEDAVFIAVENGNRIIIRYDYNTNTFSNVQIPINSIKYFASENSTVFGVGEGSVIKYENGKWEVVTSNFERYYPTSFAVKNNFAFIAYGSDIEVVHLKSGKKSLWTSDELPIKGQINAIQIRENGNPGEIKKAYGMYLGTSDGLVICNLNLQSGPN
jgi:hypothetical protein